MTKEELGRKIRIVREIKNLSQSYLADMIETSQSHYSKIERGLVDVSMGTLQRVADVLQVGLTDLINFDPQQVLVTSSSLNLGKGYGYTLNRKQGKVDLIIDHYRC